MVTDAVVAMAPVDCPLCGSGAKRVRWQTPLDQPAPLESFFRCTNSHYGRFGRIVECLDCGLLYRDPRERDLLAAYAEAVDEDYLGEWAGRRESFRRTLGQLHRFIQPPGRLLDVGASAGFFLRVARDGGWRAEGLEPSRWAADLARRDGFRVALGTLDDHPFGPGEFDAVTLWDVIEHVPDPGATLQAAFELVRPGGVIGLTTMDVGSLVARLLGPRWPHLMRMHLCYFRPAHIERLLLAAGFVEPRCLPHVRVLKAGYLATRFSFAGEGLGRMLAALVRASGQAERLVPICLGDLFACYARRPG
jgi:SAM-dependent methyltransferase